jgi:glutathione S-transferase
VRLFFSSTSPFARKVRVFAREKRLASAITEVECNPYADPAELRSHNKLGMVPTLVAGRLVLYDSPVICEYLDSRITKPRLIPQVSLGRWQVLRAQALADGLMEVAVRLTIERRRPAGQQSPDTQDRWQEQIEAAVAAMDEELEELSVVLNLGHIAFAAALGYLDFRYPRVNWRADHPRLAEWFDPFSQRPSMLQTAHSESSYLLPSEDV